jgi:hypothetical protein
MNEGWNDLVFEIEDYSLIEPTRWYNMSVYRKSNVKYIGGMKFFINPDLPSEEHVDLTSLNSTFSLIASEPDPVRLENLNIIEFFHEARKTWNLRQINYTDDVMNSGILALLEPKSHKASISY